MTERSPENLLSTETTYKFTTFDQLQVALKDNGWSKDRVDNCFRWLPPSLKAPFPERSMTGPDLLLYAAQLEAAKTQYEQRNLLKQVALQDLRKDIGATISFETLSDLESALEQRGITYPKSYLEQPWGSFIGGWGGPRNLTKNAYEFLIESLLSVQNSPEYVRGAIIAKAFNTPDKIALTVENLIESNYPDKQTAFADAIRKAQSFPFIVRYSESGKSYELPVSLEKNTLVIGQRVFTFSNSEWIVIQSIDIAGDKFNIKGSLGFLSQTQSLSKEDFIKNILPKLLNITNSTPVNFMGYTIDVSVSGSENPKEILANGNTSPDNTQIDAKAAIEQIDASNLESIKTGIQKMKPLLDAFEKLSPEKSLAAEGTIGALLLDRLQASNLHLQIQNGNIRVLSSNPADQSYATQLETFFQSEVGMNQILGLGMMYRTSEYQNYANVYLNEDNTVKSGEKSNYVQYLNNAKKHGWKNAFTQADRDFLASSSAIMPILHDPKKLDQILLGRGFLADGNAFLAQNPQILANVSSASSVPLPKNISNSNIWVIPDSGKIPSWKEDPVTHGLATLWNGLSWWADNLLKTPGAMQWLLIAFALTWFFGDFKKAMMLWAWAFWLSAVFKELGKNGVDLGDLAKEGAKATTDAAASAWDAISGAANSASTAVNNLTESEKNLTPTQKKASDKVRNSPDYKIILDPEKIKTHKYTAGMEDYLKFINTDLSDKKVSAFLGNDNSIFTKNKSIDQSIKLPSNMDPAIFRWILRMYITGTFIPNFKIDEPNNVKLRKSALSKIPNADTSLRDAISKIYA